MVSASFAIMVFNDLSVEKYFEMFHLAMDKFSKCEEKRQKERIGKKVEKAELRRVQVGVSELSC
jgi:hypothetical protein